jgi:hypothetical protein
MTDRDQQMPGAVRPIAASRRRVSWPWGSTTRRALQGTSADGRRIRVLLAMGVLMVVDIPALGGLFNPTAPTIMDKK